MPRARYDTLSIALHWTSALLVAAEFASLWAHDRATGSSAALLLELHRSAGLLLWVLTLVRLNWKAGGAQPPERTEAPGLQRLAADMVHAALYTLLVLQPVTGFLQSIWRGRAFALFGGTFPIVVPRDKPTAQLFHDIHADSATLLLVLIGVHALAGLFHGLVRRDGVLGAMLPWGGKIISGGRE